MRLYANVIAEGQRGMPALKELPKLLVYLVKGTWRTLFSHHEERVFTFGPEMLHNFNIEMERENDGRWIAEVTELPGVMTYGSTPEEAVRNVEALALRVLADRIEEGKEKPAKSLAVKMACLR